MGPGVARSVLWGDESKLTNFLKTTKHFILLIMLTLNVISQMRIRSCLKMVTAFFYAEFSRQFRLWERKRSRSYVTDEKDENGREGRVIK